MFRRCTQNSRKFPVKNEAGEHRTRARRLILVTDEYARRIATPASRPRRFAHEAVHGGARAARARRRLRRYRHEPAVRGEGNVQSRAWHPAHAREHPRRRIRDLLGPDDRRVGEVRVAGVARRQPGRRRHHGAARARNGIGARPPARAGGAARDRRLRRVAVLRRCRAHAGDFRAICGRGTRSGHGGLQAVRRTARHRHPHRALRDPALRYRHRRARVRPGVPAVVRRAGRDRHRAHRARARDPGRHRSRIRREFRHRARLRVVSRAGLGAARVHRRRGAVRRHGAFRQARNSPRVVRRGSTGARVELFRAGRAADRASRGGREPVLPCLPAVGALSDDRARDGRDRDRVAGDDLGCVFDDAAGRAARLPATHGDPAHVRAHDGTDLRAGRQLAVARRRHGSPPRTVSR